MGTTFSTIQNNIYKFLIKQNKLKETENNLEKTDFTELYSLLKISAPSEGIDFESPEGIEYIKNLVEEFLNLDYITEMADDNKDGSLSVKEKSDFMNEELELELNEEQLEELFGKEEVEETEPSGGSTGSGNVGNGSETPVNSTNPVSTENPQSESTEASSSAKVESARQDMLTAEDAYQEKLNEVFENNTEILNLETSRAEKNDEIMNKTDEKNTLSEESDELTVTISELETKISKKDSEINDCRATISNLEAQIASAGDNTDVSALKSNLASKKSKLQRLENEKKDLEAEKEDAEDRKDEIDNTLIPEIDTAIETTKNDLTEIENQIKEKIESNSEVSELYSEYLEKRDTYNTLNEEYLKEQKEAALKKAEEEKAKRISPKAGTEDDKEYKDINELLYESKIKDEIEKYTKEFSSESDVSYSHTSNGNYEVKEIRDDGTVVVTTFDTNGEISSTRSTSLSALTPEQENKISEAINSKINGNTQNIEYEKSSDGKITASVTDEQGKLIRLTFNKDGEMTGSDDIESIVSDEAVKESIKGLNIPENASTNFEKDGDIYIVTINAEDNSESEYKYDKDGNLISSTNIAAVAKDKSETVQSSLSGIIEKGEKLEYKQNDDGSFVVTGTYGGIQTVYKFDENGIYKGSSNSKDGFTNEKIAEEINKELSELFEDGNIYYKSDDNGNVTVSTDKGTYKFTADGYTLSMESSKIEDFEEFEEDSVTQINEIISSKNISGDITYKYDYVTGEYSIEAKNGDTTAIYEFKSDENGTISLTGSPEIEDISEEETLNEKIRSDISNYPQDSTVKYHKENDGGISIDITDKDGNVSKHTYDKDGNITASSDISKFTDTDETLCTQIMSEMNNTNADLSNCVFQKSDDGTFYVRETNAGKYSLYLFDENGKLKSITTNTPDKITDDETVKNEIENTLVNMNVSSSDCIYTYDEDGFITVDLGSDSNDNSISVKFDEKGNFVSTNCPDLLFKNSVSADYAITTLTEGLGLDISNSQYTLTPDGSIKVTGKTEEDEDYTLLIDPKHGEIKALNIKEDAWTEFDEDAISKAEETLKSIIPDTAEIMYSNDEKNHFSATVIQDGHMEEYHFDEDGNLVKYKNALGVYETKTDEDENEYIAYTPASTPNAEIKTDISDLAGTAKNYTGEATSYITNMSVKGKTDAEKISLSLKGLGKNESGENTEETMTAIYEETVNAEKINGTYPNGTIAVITEKSNSDTILQGGIVAGTVETEDETKYIILEPSANGEVKITVRTEEELEFRIRNN